ncbi:MAG: RsmD family RNA methyltransferase, partial [bacterium]|nr:RsmD family RNA methyltransferase [bacterium]
MNYKFDIVYLDPPYNMKILNKVLIYLVDNQLLNNNALVICEVNDEYIEDNINYQIVNKRKYNDKFIYILKFLKI